MNKTVGRTVTIAAVLAMGLLGGCRNSTIAIKSLLDDPSRYDKQTVRIAGTVGSTIGVLGYGAYQIDDGTGTLTVVSKEGGAPRQGVKVEVEGEFRSAFTLGAETAAVLIEKQRTDAE